MNNLDWTTLLVALISAGLLKYLSDAVKWWVARRKNISPLALQTASIATVDQSLTVVAKARDELESDNARLRTQIRETDSRHVSDRDTWAREKMELKGEIQALEQRLRDLLTEVQDLQARHS